MSVKLFSASWKYLENSENLEKKLTCQRGGLSSNFWTCFQSIHYCFAAKSHFLDCVFSFFFYPNFLGYAFVNHQTDKQKWAWENVKIIFISKFRTSKKMTDSKLIALRLWPSDQLLQIALNPARVVKSERYFKKPCRTSSQMGQMKFRWVDKNIYEKFRLFWVLWIGTTQCTKVFV